LGIYCLGYYCALPKYSADVRWSEEDRAYVALCPELGDLSALGDSPQEAVTELGEAIDLATQAYRAEGWPLPEPAVHRLAEARGQGSARDRGELASEEASPVEIAP